MTEIGERDARPTAAEDDGATRSDRSADVQPAIMAPARSR